MIFNIKISGGNDLPNVKWLRQHYLPQIKKDYDENMKANIQGKKIVVQCDEATNRKGEAVFVNLFKILPNDTSSEVKLLVSSVKNLSICNGDQCSKTILQTLNSFDVNFKNVVGITTDSAAYMNLCIRLLKELVNPNMIHIQCWAHKLDKVSQIFYNKLLRLNECVSKVKKLFKNTRKRKNRYLKFLTDKYSFSKQKKAKLFPLPVLTRWGSWRISAEYLYEYVEDVVEYAKSLPEDVRAVQYFKKLSDEDIRIIQAEAAFVLEYGSPVSELLLLIEGSKYPLAHLLYPKIRKLCTSFSVVKNAEDIKSVISKKTKDCLCVLTRSKQRNAEGRIKAVCAASLEKLQKFLAEDTARSFFNASETLFYPPKMLSVPDSNYNTITLKAKQQISLLDHIPNEQFLVLYGLLRDQVLEVSKTFYSRNKNATVDIVEQILIAMRPHHSEFAVTCLQIIYMPVSNVDSERAISAYGDVLSPKRCRLKADNTEIMMCIYFGDDLDENDIDDNNN